MILNRLRARLGRAARRFGREDGNASVEFVVVFPVLFYMLICAAESGYMLARSVMLDRALDLTVRSLRLGLLPGVQHAQLKALICADPALKNTGLMRNCEQIMMLELRPVDTDTFQPLNNSPTCVDRNPGAIQPVTDFRLGAENELMLVRACAVVNPIFPLTGVGFHLPKDSTGGYQLVSMSAFVNEPRR
ncbi:MAG: pilus assembly protein [Rhodobacteraceae bacterium]|nr:pilus assembly protein [Paracoccaceae bacterium]